jgi:hypothetical protein
MSHTIERKISFKNRNVVQMVPNYNIYRIPLSIDNHQCQGGAGSKIYS